MPRLLRQALSTLSIGTSRRSLATAVPVPATAAESSTANAVASSSSSSTAPPKWTPFTTRTGLLAKKRGMTALWDQEGVRWPVTVLQVDSCHVIRHEPPRDSAGRYILQLGCSDKDPRRASRMEKGPFRKAGTKPKYHLGSFQVTEDALVPVGSELSAAHFVPGQYVDVIAKTIGKGFQGVMKRHGFRGQPASHGTTKVHRHGGAIGANQDPGKVWKGKKMPGRMGGKQRTSHSLLVHRIDKDLNLIYVRGAVPGFDDALISVRDAIRKVQWRAEEEFKRGKEEDQWLPQGVTSLPMPTVTVKQAAAATWPSVLEWPGNNFAKPQA